MPDPFPEQENMFNAKTKKGYERIGLLYIMPWLLGFILFNIIPISSSFFFAFSDLKLINQPHFIGFGNFTHMFTKDDLFLQSLKVTFLYTLMAVPGKVGFALLVALILNLKIRFVGFFRLVYYLPSILGGSVMISVLWRFLFMRDGFANALLKNLTGLGPIDWLGPDLALQTISLLPIWQFGSSMVLFLAALKNVPKELYEASRVDGATAVKSFLHVTLPLISPIIFFNLVMQTINELQQFTAAFIVTGGGPMYSTYVIGIKIWDEAFRFLKMGYASALSWVLVVIILMMTVLMFLSSRFWVFYDDKRGL